MSSVEAADAKEIVQQENEVLTSYEENEVLTSYEENEVREQNGGDFPEKPEQLEKSEENSMPSSQEEEAVLKKKYGGMLPKKPPLISKDHERAFFDSADWALGKQGGPVGHKPKGPLEALRPKLQPTQHHQVRSRRSAYAPADSEDGGQAPPEELNAPSEESNGNN